MLGIIHHYQHIFFFVAQKCPLLIMQPIFFGPRSVLQAILSNKINFGSAYCHIHGTWPWVPHEVTQDLSTGLNGCACSLTSPYRHRLYNTDTSLLRTVRLVPEMPKSYIPNLYNTNTSVNRTHSSVTQDGVRKVVVNCLSYFSYQAINNSP